MPPNTDPSFKQLLQDSLSSVQEIIRSEITLAKVETKEQVGEAGRSGAILGGGVVLALYAGLLLLMAGVSALFIVLPLWLSFLIMGAVVFAAAAAMILKGRRRLQQVHVAPERAISSTKETMEWAKHRSA
jgi:Flp pilus assembly protein TadB